MGWGVGEESDTWARSCMDGFVGPGKTFGFFIFLKVIGRFWRIMKWEREDLTNIFLYIKTLGIVERELAVRRFRVYARPAWLSS